MKSCQKREGKRSRVKLEELVWNQQVTASFMEEKMESGDDRHTCDYVQQ